MLPPLLPTTPGKTSPRSSVLVMWIIWFGILNAFLVVQFTIGQGLPRGQNALGSHASPIVFVAIASVLVGTVLRWFFIPRAKHSGQQLVTMIVGLALGESAGFFGIFLLPADQPQTKLLLFALAVFGIAQFAPVYALPGSLARYQGSDLGNIG